MGVKKAAAEALGVVGSAAAIGPVLGWLARHDSPGLRDSALDRAAGEAATGVLFRAAGAARGRARELLLRALDGRLDLAVLLRARALGVEPAAELVDACRSGTLRLARGTAEALQARVFAAERAREGGDALGDAIDAIERDGTSEERALALLAATRDVAPERTPRLSALLSSRFEEWVKVASEE